MYISSNFSQTYKGVTLTAVWVGLKKGRRPGGDSQRSMGESVVGKEWQEKKR